MGTPQSADGSGEESNYFFARKHGGISEPRLEMPGDVIDDYRLIEVIGEGGFGTVWKAEQQSPVRRTVAFKVIKPGMDTKAVLARFEAEQQALALMNHPNIAGMYGAGATPKGRPYFAMEFVPGIPITEHCRTGKLAIDQRLTLFRLVCDGVHHAHTKGVIHRDLSARNILVSAQDSGPGIPKIIDFGVAKAVSHRLTEQSVFTELGVLIGTPEYMSPEQAEMNAQDIDTRSDIYSLGVLLYELLTGFLPFDSRELRSKAYHEIQRIIRQVDPPRPSTRLRRLTQETSAIADERRARLKELERRLRHELEWIPLKAMKKNRSERYESAAELSKDISNYLANRPLSAGPDSLAYVLWKLFRRYKGRATSAAALVLAFAGAVCVSTWYGIHERRERTTSDAVVSFLADDLLAGADPHAGGSKSMTVHQLLDDAARKLAGRFDAQPWVEARLRLTLGRAYVAMGRPVEAEGQFDRYLELRKAVHRGSIDELSVEMQIVEAAWRQDTLEKQDLARSRLNRLLARWAPKLGQDDPRLLELRNNFAGALKHMGSTLAMAASEDDATALEQASACLLSSMTEYQQVWALRKQRLGVEHIDSLVTECNLGLVKLEQSIISRIRKDQVGQRTLLLEAESDLVRVSGSLKSHHPNQPNWVYAKADLGRVQLKLGEFDHTKYEEAIHGLLDVIPLLAERDGENGFRTVSAMGNLARAYMLTNRHDEAVRWYTKAVPLSLQARGPDSASYHMTCDQATCLAELKKFDEANSALEALYAALPAADSDGRRQRLVTFAEGLFRQARDSDVVVQSIADKWKGRKPSG